MVRTIASQAIIAQFDSGRDYLDLKKWHFLKSISLQGKAISLERCKLIIKTFNIAPWYSWLVRCPVTAEVTGSSPVGVAYGFVA